MLNVRNRKALISTGTPLSIDNPHSPADIIASNMSHIQPLSRRLLRLSQRPFTGPPTKPRTMTMSSSTNPHHKPTRDWDWNVSQYLKFEDERTQPARDLLARVPLTAPRRIVDLGCGPGNSTAVLESRYPAAQLAGIDSSADMIRSARAALPRCEFAVDNLESYVPPAGVVDLFYSNAVIHWLKRDERFGIVKRLMETQPSGGVFALQVPDNLAEPSHVLMRETADSGPWAGTLADVGRDSFQSPREIYDELKPVCSKVDIFHTSYYHALERHESIIEWVKGTGLRPYLDPLQPQEKEGFLAEYLKRLQEAYPASFDGRVLLRYPRLFVVAVKK